MSSGLPYLLESDINIFGYRYSIATEGALLNNTLKKKAYLRITMGKGMGESPGIPYVLEIWPKGKVELLLLTLSKPAWG